MTGILDHWNTLLLLFLQKGIELWNEMAPYLLFGFFIAGVLHVLVRQDRISKWIGKPSAASAARAAIFGVPLPLCSCGVIPTGISFYNQGASKGSTVSFLISTPQTGVDSILATYSLLGLPMAILRPIISFVTGITGGIFVNKMTQNDHKAVINQSQQIIEPKTLSQKISRMFHYAFVEFLEDIANWLLLGILIAALFAVIIPDNFFTQYIGNDYLSMLIILAASIPLYVCATGSIPIAAVLMMKGLSPGAAIVLLMAGPATNAATITVVGKVMGRKTLILYLMTIIGGALISGILVNQFLPRSWFVLSSEMLHQAHNSHLIPGWVKIGSGIILALLIVHIYIRIFIIKIKDRNSSKEQKEYNMGIQWIEVEGMTCNHCKMNVEKSISNVPGVASVTAEPTTGKVKIDGANIDLNLVQQKVEQAGYEYKGPLG